MSRRHQVRQIPGSTALPLLGIVLLWQIVQAGYRKLEGNISKLVGVAEHHQIQ